MHRPHLLYLAWGFPPAAKSCTYRMLATANSFNRAGWRVTVVTLTEDAWLREHGLDDSLLDLVDPDIEIERLPLYRDDLETDIRRYSRLRAQRPKEWLRYYRRQDQKQFPELVFGRWHDELVEATRRLHEQDPADLVLTSASPYTFFAPALDLWERDKVPFVLDYRDAWAIDIIGDEPAFAPNSRRGRFERRLMDAAREAWFVNAPIRDAYGELYPDRRADLQVVRNGADVAIGTNRIPARHPAPGEGLRFGYLGTVTFTPARTRDICDAFRLAGERHELIAASTLEFRGHVGAGSARGANGHTRVISRYAGDGVSFGGPVAKAETADVYASWDALVLCLVGGRFVTSGKVFDYVSTGLPVMSVHETEHAAAEILQDYPLWVRNEGLSVEEIADAFVRTADLIASATPEQRTLARAYADRYERYAQIQPAVERLTRAFVTEDEGAPVTAAPSEPVAAPSAEELASAGTEPESMLRVERPAPVPHARGQHVVMAYTSAPPPVAVDAIKTISANGGRVALVGPQIRGYEAAAKAADQMVFLRHMVAPVDFDRDNPPRRYSAAWASVVSRNLARRATFKPAQKVLGAATLWWRAAQMSRETMRLLESADVICAVDAGAVYLVWESGRRNRSAAIINGVGPTLEHLGLSR